MKVVRQILSILFAVASQLKIEMDHKTIEAAERKALLSLSTKDQHFDTRRNELNLLEELRKYRKSDEFPPFTKKHSPIPRRKTKSI